MRFYVVNSFIPESPIAPIESKSLSDVSNIGSVMWVPFPRSIDPTQLDYMIANCPPHVLRSDVTIIGLHPTSARTILANQYILDDVSHRIEDASLFIVYHKDGKPTIKHISGPNIEGLESQKTLTEICDRDISEVVRRPGTELPKHPGIHYEGPNGDHYEAFLRPGFAARSVEELDRIAFWLAPILSNKNSVLVDHWSMIAVAYHVAQYAINLGKPTPTSVQSLRAYDENRDVLVSRLKGVFGTVEPSAGAILVSVNSSGRLVRDVLLPAMGEIGFRDPVTMALAKTPSPAEFELPALTTLDEHFKRHVPSECSACMSGGSVLIPIHSDSYLLSLAAHTHTSAIKRSTARESTEVIERYRGIGAFQVHKTHTDGRHHSYFIDLIPILTHNIFQTRLTATVRRWIGIDIEMIIHPDDEAAARLADAVGAQLGIKSIIRCDETLKRLTSEERNEILRSRRICVVDDVVVSGARVFGYRNSLNRVRRDQGLEDCELYCLVGVARPTNEKALMAVSDMFHHTSSNPRFLSVERLFLPHWNEDECRWCAEMRLLGKLSPEIQDRPLIRDRIRALGDPEGLIDNLFLPWTGNQGIKESPSSPSWSTSDSEYDFWELGPESVFGEVQGADLAVSVAAAIQRMRGSRRLGDGTWSDSDLDEVFRSPLAKVLDPQLYLAGRYYEPVLVASILRASKRHDIRAPGNDSALQDRIRLLAKAESSKELHGELLLATAVNQLPSISSNAIAQAHPDMAALARAIQEND